MYPITAAALLLGSIACLLMEDDTRKWRSLLAGILASAVFLTGIAVLSEYLFGISPRIDQALFGHTLLRQAVSNGGRIGPSTALNLALVGAALLSFLRRKEKPTPIAPFLTVSAALIAFVAVSGYAYSAPYLYQVANFTAMSLPAAVAFLLLCGAVMMFCCEPRHGFGILLGLVFLLAVVSVTTVVSVHATRTLIANNSRVEHTRIVAQELDATLTALLNVETGERGYLYTGEKHYLEPYEIGRSEMDGHLRRLATLTVDNPVQQHNLARLQHSTQEAMDFFEQAVGFEAAGQEVAAKKLLLTGGSKARMDAVRALLGDMRAEELRILNLRLEESQQSARYLLLAIPASQAFTATLLLLAGLLVRRDVRKRGETARRFRELAEREHDARQLADLANQRTENILSSISDMFLLLDDRWNILYVNEQVLRFSGRPREALVGKQYWSVFPETLGTKFEFAYRHAMEAHTPEAFEAFDASLRKWFSVQLYPSSDVLTIFAQDITAIKHARDALVRSEKLAAVGRMAATVAHEINNPLEAVTNLIWIASRDPSISEGVRESLRVADSELKRVAHITRQTLGFYRDTSAPAMVNMREVMNSVLELYSSRVTSKQISIHTDYEDCAVYGFAGEFRQLFSNLCANAIDAVKMGGKLRVKLSEVHRWKEPDQSGVRVTVADDGCGVPPEHLDSIFEPFFTTKDSTGTGLGLWVAKQIVEKHGGWITVRSSVRPNQHYTAVSVFLPSRAEIQHKTLAATAPAEFKH